ncbi:MAG: metal-dependent transcriptional regulator [Methanoregula sp.]|nr:metal-dependent transcriptional regulator [Methanoregula sp.]
MLPSQREDYLEAIQHFMKRNGYSPKPQDLEVVFGKPEPEIRSDLDDLRLGGDITISGDKSIILTQVGRSVGESVIKKHETLQLFLSEILGMDSSAASSEACTLEHAVSEETVDRLGDYLKRTRQTGDTRDDGQMPSACEYMETIGNETCIPRSLLDFNEGDELVVLCILGQTSAKRLLDLGVVPGEKVKIRRKHGKDALVLQVKGCDVALSPEIAASVSVERSP